jgi:hypothetical protein
MAVKAMSSPGSSKSDLWKLSSKGYKKPLGGGMQLIQPRLYATTGLTGLNKKLN